MKRLALSVAASIILWGSSAFAEAPVTSPENVRLAREHFERAQDAYRRGAYRDAVVDLKQAIEYDPTGKDLEYNLALVFEKLGEIESAITHFQRYRELETDPGEIERVTRMLERLEGARRELVEKRTGQPAETQGEDSPPVPADRVPVVRQERGRLDTFTYVAGSTAVASALVGVVFGVRALSERPGSDERTGNGQSIADLQSRAERAHGHAVVADVAFLVSALSAGATAWLYFGREAEPGGAKASVTASRERISFTAGVQF